MSQHLIKSNCIGSSDKGSPLDSNVSLYGPLCEGRALVENFIAAKYFQVHEAQLKEYLPLLLSVHNKGHLACAAGFRPGLYQPMFLEQYLDVPIEQEVARLAKQPVDRQSLIEVGNFAVARNGYGSHIMTLIAVALAEANYEWMIFTVTQQMERLIRRLGFRPYFLASADESRLSDEGSCWGGYYNHQPRVMAGNINIAIDVIAQSDFLSDLVARNQSEINKIACSLQGYRKWRAE